MRRAILAASICCIALAGCKERTERIIYTDEETGREVWQVSQEGNCMMPYFESQAFTYDDRYAVFCSDRDSTWKVYSTRLSDGRVEKVSDRSFSGAYGIYASGNEVVFMEDGVFYAVNVETHEERILIDVKPFVSESKISTNALFTNNGEYTAIAATNEDKSGSIYRVNVVTGEVLKVYSSPTGFTHPMINPVYPDLITFVCKPDLRTRWDLSREERARGKLINVAEGTIVPFVMSDVNYRATHETWAKNGERLYYFDKIHRYSDPDPDKGWEISVVSIDRNGGDRRQHYINTQYKLEHGIATTDERFFVADVSKPGHNPLFLINFTTGEAQIICWSNQTQPSKGNVQSEHTHPLFSRDGRYIAFTSDRNTPGHPQAFIVPIADLTE